MAVNLLFGALPLSPPQPRSLLKARPDNFIYSYTLLNRFQLRSRKKGERDFRFRTRISPVFSATFISLSLIINWIITCFTSTRYNYQMRRIKKSGKVSIRGESSVQAPGLCMYPGHGRAGEFLLFFFQVNAKIGRREKKGKAEEAVSITTVAKLTFPGKDWFS